MKGFLIRLLIAGLLALMLWSTILSHPVSSQQVESHLNILEFDFRRLETRLNQIELQLGQNRFGQNRSQPQSTGSQKRLSLSERDKMFDRLATLVIELKQQVNRLTTRVTKLESR
jgi:hypothetical protein